ncbi:MAG: NEW3 domain-containing protein [Verrucomicrobiia bacterium]
MSFRNLSQIILGCAALCVAAIVTGQEVRTTSSDVLAFTADGAWKSATVSGQRLPFAAGAPVLSVCDVERGGEYFPMSGSVRAEGGGVSMALSSEPLALKATLRIKGDGKAFKFKLRVEDTTGKDRGLLVRVGVPVNATGWKWWDDMDRPRTIEPGKLYENAKPLRAFAALPEWKDKPDLRMGYNTENFCTVITGAAGLCLAVPLDQPRIFRTAYDAQRNLFGITYDVALCKETSPASQATFEFELFACDPRWGMRSALDSYYQRHPGFFAKNLTDEGMWIAFTHLDTMDNTTEFGVAIQEGAGSAGYDDKIGVKSFNYYTHAGMYADVPNHKRGVDPTPSLERRIAAVEATFRKSTGRDGVYAECGLYDAAGKLSAEPGSVYGDVLAQFCLEPEMFYGQWLLDRIEKFYADFRKRGELDGFYYDGLTTGINYRREHFPHAGYPPSWDPVAKKPYLYNYFSSVEWARLVAEKLHGMGKFTMMNGAMGANPFCAPYLDVMGAETGLNISRSNYGFVKTICHHKTFVTLLKGNYAKMTGAEIELFMKRCLAYGVFPGFFDWPPSGLGPGGTYWDHPEYYERDRLLFRKYQPLVKTIAAAGWGPLTFASAADAALQVERFGTMEHGHVFFTVLNDSAEPVRSALKVEAEKLDIPAKDLVVFDEVAQRRLGSKAGGGTLTIPLELPPQSVALIHIAKAADFVAHHLEAAAKVFDAADIQRKADEGRPARPRYWRVTEERCFRDDGALLLRNDGNRQNTTASQWVMLFQEKACPITIRARVRTKDVTGAKGDSFALHAVVCYVDKRFTTRDPRVLPLEPGTGDWRDVEWTIEPTRPVRSIQLTLRLNGRRGSAWFDDVTVRSSDVPAKECVVDGGFDAWYERLTPEQAGLLAPKLAAVRSALSDGNTSGEKLTAALRAVQAASAIITEQHLENPARRESRDLDAIWNHLTSCSSVVLGVDGVELTAPDKAAPGEKVKVAAKLLSRKKAASRVKLSLRSETNLTIVSKRGGSEYEIVIPASAKPGEMIVLHGEATAELAAGGSLPLRASRTIAVVAPFEAETALEGVSADASQTLVLRLANNLSHPQRFKIAVNAPDGWTTTSAPQEETVPPQSNAQVRFALSPGTATKPGRYEVSVTAQSDGEPRSFRLELNHVPASANRLKNGGFESNAGTDLANWARWGGGCASDANVAHSGRQSLRLQTEAAQAHVGASQGVALNQKSVVPLIVRGWCKTEKISGDRSGCCLYVDVYYADGTKLYGQKVLFDGGTHDWQFREMRIQTTKPARSVNVYSMLRGATGTAWFDDVVLAEDSSPASEAGR